MGWKFNDHCVAIGNRAQALILRLKEPRGVEVLNLHRVDIARRDVCRVVEFDLELDSILIVSEHRPLKLFLLLRIEVVTRDDGELDRI